MGDGDAGHCLCLWISIYLDVISQGKVLKNRIPACSCVLTHWDRQHNSLLQHSMAALGVSFGASGPRQDAGSPHPGSVIASSRSLSITLPLGV